MDQQKTRYMPIWFLKFQYNLTQRCIFFWPCSITSYIHPIHLTQFTPTTQLLWTQTRSNHRKNRWWFLSSQLKTTSFDGVFQWVLVFDKFVPMNSSELCSWQGFFQWFFSLKDASLNHHLSGKHKSQGFCWRDTLGFTSTGLKGEGERHTAIWRFILFRSGGNPEFEK